MAWTYDPSVIAATPLYQVRNMIGDTVQANPQLQDEEVRFWLSQRSSVWGAAAECCRALATQYSRSIDQTAGDTGVKYSQMAKAYASRATTFEARAAAMGSGTPYAGGISITDKINQELNTDRVDPQFNIGMTDDWLPVGPVANETLDGGGSGNDPDTSQ
jgi:hypothetical protein